MAQRAQYHTKQMTELLDYLRSVQGRHVTAGEIGAYFRERGVTIGAATIYRHLERMVEEGAVAKYIVDGTSGACFEYIGEEGNGGAPACYHCKCEQCGKLIHLRCGEVARFGAHLLEGHGFAMDPMRTVIYGVCGECRGKHQKIRIP